VNAPHTGDSALRISGVGFGASGLGQNRYSSGLSRPNRVHEARNTAADNQKVTLKIAPHLELAATSVQLVTFLKTVCCGSFGSQRAVHPVGLRGSHDCLIVCAKLLAGGG